MFLLMVVELIYLQGVYFILIRENCMKTLTAIIILTLIVSVCYAETVTCDPNDIIESPTDPNNMLFTCTIEITKQEYKAMQVLKYDLQKIFRICRFGDKLEGLILKAKTWIIRNDTVTEVEDMAKEE